MRFDGAWRLCDDGITRPLIEGEIEAADGSWLPVTFLTDCGADRTVFCAEVLHALGLPPRQASSPLRGVGGIAHSVFVTARLRLFRETGASVFFPGEYAAFTDLPALDMSVLGRDITNLFPLIVDRQGGTVCLLGPGHRYVIVEG